MKKIFNSRSERIEPILRPSTRMSHQDKRPAVACRPERIDGLYRHAIETGRTRLLITGTVMALAFGVIALRLVDVGALQTPREPRSFQAASADATKNERADILDRNGELLATSLKIVSLSANPSKITNPQEVAVKLAAILPDQKMDKLVKKLSSDQKFIWIERRLTPQQHWEVNRLGIPGLEFRKTETRVYPQGPLVGHILGYTDVDNRGLSGVEKSFDEALRGSVEPLQLTIDMRIQHMMREELSAAVVEYSAIGGAGIVLDATNGEVISLVSLPDFDPNHPAQADGDSRFNRATLGVYELGSTFKIFNTALALETGISTMQSGYDATKPIKIARFSIRDYHAKKRVLSVPEIFIYSSNIGSALMAQEVGSTAQKAFMRHIGFLDQLSLEIPETGSPQFPDVWRPINTMTIAFGHGLSVSPMHLASGVATMVNGGTMYSPTLIKTNSPPKGEPGISKKTSTAIRKLMRLNNIEGSGKNSDAKGYLVGGKTGTAEKAGGGSGYNRKSLISSYVAAFPMNDPKYVVYVVLDEPQGTKKTFGYATGGWVAAPVIKNVINRMAPIVGITPIDDQSPEIRQELAIELPRNGGKTLASF